MNKSDELLTSDELYEITGYKHIARQRDWLDKQGWTYVQNAARRPIVSRQHARMLMSGITPTGQTLNAGWKPDFTAWLDKTKRLR